MFLHLRLPTKHLQRVVLRCLIIACTFSSQPKKETDYLKTSHEPRPFWSEWVTQTWLLLQKTSKNITFKGL